MKELFKCQLLIINYYLNIKLKQVYIINILYNQVPIY